MQKPQRILVFQQNGSGVSKIKGIRQHGGDGYILDIVSIDRPLPPIIDDAREYLPDTLDADVVLDYLKHPDLSYDLSQKCRQLRIPVVASGKKMKVEGVFTPPT
jgi:hypothetical protein